MARMLVIADDLTGAADCGVACAGYGLRTMVALDDCGDADADVLAIDADTRAAAPEQAAARTARLVRAHGGGREILVYKKLDSTLRGNVAVELAAALDARRALAGKDRRIVAVLAPAFPANGRTTVNGRLLVHGRPLEETELWQYERNEPPASIARLLDAAQLRSAVVDLNTVRGDTLQDAMIALARDADVLVCDAETDADLRMIAEASLVLGRETLWAGSAGLAYHLPPAAGLVQMQAEVLRIPLATGSALFVIGSGSSASREQAQLLASCSDMLMIRIAPSVLRAGEQSPEWLRHRAALERALGAQRDAAVTIDVEPRAASAAVSSQEPLLAAALADLVLPFADAVGALVATGGETARAVFRAWGITALHVVGEVEPGLPYSIATGWRRLLPVLTKAGGFGKPETLLNCRQFLRNLDREGAKRAAINKRT